MTDFPGDPAGGLDLGAAIEEFTDPGLRVARGEAISELQALSKSVNGRIPWVQGGPPLDPRTRKALEALRMKVQDCERAVAANFRQVLSADVVICRARKHDGARLVVPTGDWASKAWWLRNGRLELWAGRPKAGERPDAFWYDLRFWHAEDFALLLPAAMPPDLASDPDKPKGKPGPKPKVPILVDALRELFPDGWPGNSYKEIKPLLAKHIGWDIAAISDDSLGEAKKRAW